MIQTALKHMLLGMQTLWGILKRCICVLPHRNASFIRDSRFENSLQRKNDNLHKTSKFKIEREHYTNCIKSDAACHANAMGHTKALYMRFTAQKCLVYSRRPLRK